MDYMFTQGFLGTKAPLFMDFVTVIVTLLPLLVWIAIKLVRAGYYETHRVYQIVIFIVSVIVVGWFEYGVRAGGGFALFIEGNSLPNSLLYGVLIFHIVIATLSFIWWAKTLYTGNKYYRNKNLPGGCSIRHIADGKLAALGIFMTSLSALWLYIALFMF